MEIYTGLIEFNWTLLFIWVNILILYLILKKFFFEKIHNFVQARQNAITDAFDSADQKNAEAEATLEEYKTRIAGIEGEGREIVRTSKLRADDQAQKIIEEANQKAAQMLLHAEQEIQKEKERALAEMKEEVADLAIYAAEKILERELNEEKQRAFVLEIIKEAGRKQWQS